MKRIRITATLDVLLDLNECTEGDSPEEALAAAQEGIRKLGPARFIREWFLDDLLDVEARIEG